jgi:hypothetical protein
VVGDTYGFGLVARVSLRIENCTRARARARRLCTPYILSPVLSLAVTCTCAHDAIICTNSKYSHAYSMCTVQWPLGATANVCTRRNFAQLSSIFITCVRYGGCRGLHLHLHGPCSTSRRTSSTVQLAAAAPLPAPSRGVPTVRVTYIGIDHPSAQRVGKRGHGAGV